MHQMYVTAPQGIWVTPARYVSFNALIWSSIKSAFVLF